MIEERKKPFLSLIDGGVKVVVWENKDEKGRPYFSYVVERVYKDGDDWRTTNSFSGFDLLRAVRLCEKAYDLVTHRGVLNEGG